ncbi:MAG: hypothetical protein IAE89_05840 [Anaerolineae bacterium]|nr:hypothetical protein [Anaerolineae bacterium]
MSLFLSKYDCVRARKWLRKQKPPSDWFDPDGGALHNIQAIRGYPDPSVGFLLCLRLLSNDLKNIFAAFTRCLENKKTCRRAGFRSHLVFAHGESEFTRKLLSGSASSPS